MPWDNWNSNNDLRSCYNNRPRNSYYDSRDRYWGPLEWWSVFANLLLSWTTDPMEEPDHLLLSNNINNGRGMEDILEIGRRKASHPLLNGYLLSGAVVSLLILFIGIGKKFRKNQVVPIPKDKTRGRMVPLWLAHVPLFLLTLFFAIAFSLSLWPSYDNYMQQRNRDDPITYAKNTEEDHKWMGQCYLDNLTTGQQSLEETIDRMTRNFTTSCQADYSLQGRRNEVQKDKETLEEIRESAKSLKDQLAELKALGTVNSDVVELDYAVKILTKIENNLQEVQKGLDNTYEATEASMAKIQTQKDAINDAMEKLNEPLFATFAKTSRSFRESKDTLDEAVKTLSSWSQTVSSRFTKLDRDIRIRDKPLALYIALQAIVGISAVIALVGLGFGFLTLAVGLAYPKALNWIPVWTKLTKRVLLLSFVLVGLGAIAIFYTSGIFLRFAAPATSVCNTLRAVDNFNYSSDALRFYETLGLKITLKNTDGKTFSVNYGELLSTTPWRSLASKDGNQREDLFLTKNVNLAFKNWKNVISKREAITIPEIKIPDQSKLTRPLKLAMTALEDVDFTHSEKSALFGLVAKEIRTFKRLLQQMELASLRELTIPECVSQGLADYQMSSLTSAYEGTFNHFVERVASSRGSDESYQPNKYLTAYKGATGGFCIQLLVPFSGVWLSTMLLGTVLLLDMIVIYKASNRLVAQAEAEVASFNNVNFLPAGVSSISSPLLDPKSQEECEILEI